MTTPPETQVQSETLEQGAHVFVPGVWFWSQRLCRECYKPFYYNIHNPSFAKSVGPSGKDGNKDERSPV